jgi:hypothetical protein
MWEMKTPIAEYLLAALLLAPAAPALADTEFGQMVPREVVEQFIGNPLGGEGKIYSDILDAFPQFALPAGFEVLASAEHGLFQRVILKTRLDDVAATTALVNAFIAEGWMEIPVLGAGAQTGFIAGAPVARPTQLCSDAHGTLSISVGTGGVPRYVNLTGSARTAAMGGGRQPSCAEQAALMAPGGAMRRMMGPRLSEYMPRLVMPVSATAPNPAMGNIMGGGGGGSSDEWESRGALAIDWNIQQIFTHFSDQVVAQGWTQDAAVSGAQVASGSWTRNVDGLDLIGLLTIVATAPNSWDLRFRLVNKGEAGTPPGMNRNVIRQDVTQ